MNLNPMEQFAVKPAFGLDKPLLSIAGHPIYFTNQAFLMVIVTMCVGINFVVDVLYSLLDPRVRPGGAPAGAH